MLQYLAKNLSPRLRSLHWAAYGYVDEVMIPEL
jgi:hypothetical protein